MAEEHLSMEERPLASGWSHINVSRAEEGLVRARVYAHDVSIDIMRGHYTTVATINVPKKKLKAFVHIMNKTLSELLEKVESQAT